MWVPPGQTANHHLWRYDVAQKSFLPPGTPGKPAGIQVEMPQSYTGQEPRGFHMMASPAGTQAPIEHINYTPETGAVSGRGVQAPPDKLNYTLMPQEALQGAGQGMGAGAAVPSLNAFGDSQFAGTPPLAGSPTMTGPSPTTNAAAPRWGGGGTSFDSRMGMGAEGDQPNLMDTTTATGDSAGSAATSAPAGTQGPPVSQDPAVNPNVPKNLNGEPAKQGDVINVTKDANGSVIMYTLFDGLDNIYDTPKVHYVAGSSPKAQQPQYEINKDTGAIDVIDLTKPFDPNNPGSQVTRIKQPDPDLVKAAQTDQATKEANLRLATANAHLAEAKDDNAKGLAQIELKTAQANADRAQAESDKAKFDLAHAGQPTPAAKPNKITDVSGEVYTLNNDTGQYDDTGLREAAGAWTQFNDTRDGMVHLINPQTKEDFTLAPIDKFKEYPPMKVAGGKWVQWDPSSATYKTIYTEDPDYTTQVLGDELLAVNKNNASDVKVIWKKKPTQAEGDAHDAAIDAHNTAMLSLDKTRQDLATGKITAAAARVTMEKDLQDLLHPKPVQISAGSFMVPPGLDVDIQNWNPMTDQHSVQHLSGGPQDPRIAQMMSELDKYLGPMGSPPPTSTTTPATTDTSAAKTTGGVSAVTGQQTQTDAQGKASTAGEQILAQDTTPTFKPGWAGSDPQLSGTTQPPHSATTGSGDIAHYDAEGHLIGISYKDTSDDTAEGDQSTGGNFFDSAGNRAVGPGAGNMGAGMAAGWAPRPGAFAPATGPGFLGSGADETEQPSYDKDGNPIEGAGADDDPTTPPLTSDAYDPSQGPQGHVPGINVPTLPDHIVNPGEIKMPGPMINTGPGISLPGATDQGVNWIPGLKDLVTQKVNESLRELLGWPKLEHTPPPGGPLIGTQGGHDQPEIDPYDTINKKRLPPGEPSDARGKGVRDLTHMMGEGGTSPEDWVDMQSEEGIEKGAGRNADPDAQRILQEKRDELGTTGVGQDEGAPPPDPTATLPPSGTAPPPTQTPPQGSGGQPPPLWLLTLLKAHPELLQQLGLGGQAAGTGPPPGASPAGWQPPQPQPPQPQQPPQGAGAEIDPLEDQGDIPWGPSTHTVQAILGKTGGNLGNPLDAARGRTQKMTLGDLSPGALGTGADEGPPLSPLGGPPDPSTGAGPVAPSPEGGPMTPPLDPSDVAGIGHRFGQDMNVGEPQHSGVDLQAPEGTPTQSPVDGFVAQVENNPGGLGVTVVIHGMDGSEHRLGHLKETSAYAGMQVKMGQNLGSPVGDTGMTTGAHLHWGVKDGDGQPADPTAALGPMASMPPVPGTQMMGPPGGVGGAAQQGAPQAPPMGGGHDAGWKPRKRKGKKGAGADAFSGGPSSPALLGSTTWSAAMHGGQGPGAAQPGAASGPSQQASSRMGPVSPAQPTGNFAAAGAPPLSSLAAQATPPSIQAAQTGGAETVNTTGWQPRMGGGNVGRRPRVGAGQARGRMGAGANQDWAALQNQLQQTWNTMSQAQMSPGQMGSRMGQQGSMFNTTPQPRQSPFPQQPQGPPPTMQGAAPQGPSVGAQMGQALRPGGPGGGGAFAQAGAMPTSKPMPMGPSMPKGSTLPASATPQSQQAGWTPQ